MSVIMANAIGTGIFCCLWQGSALPWGSPHGSGHFEIHVILFRRMWEDRVHQVDVQQLHRSSVGHADHPVRRHQ